MAFDACQQVPSDEQSKLLKAHEEAQEEED